MTTRSSHQDQTLNRMALKLFGKHYVDLNRDERHEVREALIRGEE